MSITFCHFNEVLKEIHDVGPVVHVIPLEVLQDARVKILVHDMVLERIAGGFLRRGGGGGEVGEEIREAKPYFERIGHPDSKCKGI